LIRVCGKEIRVEGRLVRIACLEGDKYEFVDNPEAMLEGLRKCAMRIDLFTFLQKLPESLQASSENATRYRYPMEWDNLAVLPVSTFENWQMHQIRSEARNRTRQAGKKGVVVREVRFDDTLVRGIWEIYNECPIRQGRHFTHYGKNIDTVYKEEATYLDHSIFIGAYLEDKLIGFVKLVTDETKRQANLMNILSMIQHRDKAPTNALIAQAVKSCVEHGIPYLLYQNFSYGKKPPDGITKFKEVNGFLRVNLPRYYVPLTALGWGAFRLGLHHRLVEHLPEAVYGRLHELRNAWYSRKLQASTGIS
jgi:hypothetical protein